MTMIHRIAPLLFCLMSGLAHAAAPACTYTDVGSLPLRYVGEGLVPAVAGSINDMPAVMLVDTGSSTTSLTMNGAMRRDLPLFLTGTWVEGIGGAALLYRTRAKEFSIGPMHNNSRTELTVIGSMSHTPAFDAILGAPVLLQTDLEFDLRAKRMTFFKARDCDKTPLLLWKEPTIMLPFERNDDPSPNPHFTIVVNG
jgi:hypothetical protein